MSRVWREKDHPRDDDGKFTDAPGWAGKLVGLLSRQARRDLRGELTDDDYKAMVNAVRPRKISEQYHGDPIMGEIYQRQGFHQKPEVVSKAELDRSVLTAGWRELWRGVKGVGYNDESGKFVDVSPGQVAQQFRSGDTHYPGAGIYGNGTYTAVYKDVADQFSEWIPAGVIRMALSPDARVIDYGELVDEWHKMQPEFDTHYRAAQVAAGLGEDEYPWGYSNYKTNVLADMGRLGAAMGYDAMLVRSGAQYRPMGPRSSSISGPSDGDYYVVFNRGVLKVQEAS